MLQYLGLYDYNLLLNGSTKQNKKSEKLSEERG